MENKAHTQTQQQRAFTRIELAVVLGTVSLIGVMGFSVLGDNRERSERVLCANNLRQVGRAFHMWASDHGGENPFWTPYANGGALIRANDPQPPGGVFNVPGVGPVPALFRNNAWFHFAFISQELRTPGLLLCPSEQNKLRTHNFAPYSNSASSNSYLSINFRDRATSYLVGMHAMSQYPSSILSGDRTLLPNGVDGNCNANVGTVNHITRPNPSGWRASLHAGAGNLLLNDGRVEELSNPALANFLNPPAPDSAAPVIHFISPN